VEIFGTILLNLSPVVAKGRVREPVKPPRTVNVFVQVKLV